MKGVVSVAQGRLRGVWRDDLWSFSGIPYARAPVGELRWRPPLEARVVGTRSGTRRRSGRSRRSPPPCLASRARRTRRRPSRTARTVSRSTSGRRALPETPTEAPGRGRPVMVFIHGGGFTSGSGSVFLYRGGSLVRNGDTVVVTINYRLGALGFLGHRDLADPDGLVGQLGHPRPAGRARGGCTTTSRPSEAIRATSPSSASRPAGSAWPRCSARRPPPACSAGPWCRAAGCTCTPSRTRSARRNAWPLCWGSASCDRESLERVPAAELVAATEEVGQAAPGPGDDAAAVPAGRRRRPAARPSAGRGRQRARPTGSTC